MLSRTRELWYALVAIIVVTALYALAYVQRGAFPDAAGLVGHGIGIAGFVLILMTETLYSIRKQSTDARWGSMAGWLTFHMVTGLVGPYMVLLHTSMKFQGLAGVAMLLTIVVVVSGVVGRYIYTTMPRLVELSQVDVGAGSPDEEPRVSADVTSAMEVSAEHLESRRDALATWYSVHVPLTWALVVTALVHMAGALYYGTLQR